MKLLALDPSSSCTGYALLCGLGSADLLEGGLITPSVARGVVAQEPAWLQDHLRQQPLASMVRVTSIIHCIEELIAEHEPDVVVIETPSGLFGTGAKRGARGSLTTYGMAAGRIYEACRRLLPGAVAPVTERMWTPAPGSSAAGSGRKAGRMLAVAAIYPGRYDPDQDTADGDLADAILLGRWWLGRPK